MSIRLHQNPSVSKSGFTLIELSIVLVIIGLIAGGVLVGRDLIWASQIRATLSQVDSYKAAVSVFEMKYNCLPGDCVNATQFIENTANGNGNFRVGGPGWGGPAVFANPELSLFWQHLALANLIPGAYVTAAPDPGTRFAPGVNYPAAKIGDRYGFGAMDFSVYNEGPVIGQGSLFAANYGHVFILGRWWGDTTSRIPLHPALTGADALQIDSKIDDGRPAFGTVLSWRTGNYSGNCATSDTAADAEYNTSDETLRCGVIFTQAF